MTTGLSADVVGYLDVSPEAVSGRELLIDDVTFGAVLWIAAAVVLGLEARRTRREGIRVRIDLDLVGTG